MEDDIPWKMRQPFWTALSVAITDHLFLNDLLLIKCSRTITFGVVDSLGFDILLLSLQNLTFEYFYASSLMVTHQISAEK